MQEDARKRFLSDPRRPVLYLRPFHVDSRSGFVEQAPETSSWGLMSPRFIGWVFRSN